MRVTNGPQGLQIQYTTIVYIFYWSFGDIFKKIWNTGGEEINIVIVVVQVQGQGREAACIIDCSCHITVV